MSRVRGPRDEFRVVVTPRDMGDFGNISIGRLSYGRTPDGQQRWERDMQSRCEEISAEIRRHVDSVQRVDVEFDQPYVCSHCGALWTEAGDSNECCDEDVSEHDARAAGATP